MKTRRKILTFTAVLSLLFLAFRFYYRTATEEEKGGPQPDPEICNFQIFLPDLDGDGGDEKFINCKEKIQLALSTKYYDVQNLDTIDTFYDLFFFVNNGNKEPYADYYVPREFFTFPTTKPKFIAVTATFFTGTMGKTAFAVYKIDGQKVERVFKKSFDEISGRNNYVDFFTDTPGFKINSDVGYLGAAMNRMLWFDFYYWDENKQTFEIQNRRHKDEFRELLKWYEEADKECANLSYGEFESITALYQKDPTRDYYCDPQASIGYSKQNVESFLEAKRKIQEILSSP